MVTFEKKIQFFLLFAIEMVNFFVFWQKKVLGPLGVKPVHMLKGRVEVMF